MSEMRLAVVMCNAGTSAYETGGRRAAVWLSTRPWRLRQSVVQPNIVTNNALIGTYDNGGWWQTAEEAFKVHRGGGVTFNEYTSSALISV